MVQFLEQYGGPKSDPTGGASGDFELQPPFTIPQIPGSAEAFAVTGAGAGLSGEALVLGGRVFNVTDTGLADTDFTLTHNLGLAPFYWVQLNPSVAADVVYNGSTWPNATPNTITLRCASANANVWILLVVGL